VKTSSTSSSSSRRGLGRLPWAGLLALALLLALDRGVFGAHAPWSALSARDPFGIATPLLALQEIRSAPPHEPRVLAVGPSRVVEDFSKQIARNRLPGVAIEKVAHPRFDPFVIRALVDDLLAVHPQVVVFVWSELDTHRPLRLEPVPGSSAASLAAAWDLLRLTDARFAIENRTTLYRLAAVSVLDGYRYRTALGQAGIDDLRQFDLDRRLKPPRAFPRIFGEIVFWGAEPNRVSRRKRQRIIDSFGPDADRRFVNLSIDFAAEITPGEHAKLQMAFITRSVERLRAAGVEVILMEGPMHPAAAEVYDTRLRGEFLAFVERLEREQGIHFTPLEAMPRFVAADFKDLFHTRGSGTRKLTNAAVRALRRVLTRAEGAPAKPDEAT
jgi:hypothetical protein